MSRNEPLIHTGIEEDLLFARRRLTFNKREPRCVSFFALRRAQNRSFPCRLRMGDHPLPAARQNIETEVFMILNVGILWGLAVPLSYAVGLTDLTGSPRGVQGIWAVVVSCYYLMTIAFIWRDIWLFRHPERYQRQSAPERKPVISVFPRAIEPNITAR